MTGFLTANMAIFPVKKDGMVGLSEKSVTSIQSFALFFSGTEF